jgi:uncharacterized protein with HEPN domain
MRDDGVLLWDIIASAEDALRFVADLDEKEFLGSRLHQNAVIRSIEVIGEAAGRLSSAFRNRHPQVPWREVTGMRHRLVHGYFDVRMEVVWNVVRNELPELLEILRPLATPE